MTDRLRVGTRRSALARIQTDWVVERLSRTAPRTRFEVLPQDASGDRDRTLGGSPDFTDTLDRALLAGEIDLAVHSAKDLPVRLDPRLTLVACPPREDPRDCLVRSGTSRATRLPSGARVGSSSPRRRAQLLRWRPDLALVEIRGNVDRRIGLVRSGAIDAAILAVAGIARLGRAREISRVLPLTTFLPSPAQGALAVVARTDDTDVAGVAHGIDHPATHACVTAERSFAAALDGDCRFPLGALATERSGSISLTAEVLSIDGRKSLRRRRRGSAHEPGRIGAELGRAMIEAGASELRRRGTG